MKPSDFYLCYLTVLSPAELELLHAYWEFKDTLDEYVYGTNDRKFLKSKHVVPGVSFGKLAFIASNKSLGCSSCGDKFKANSRTKFKALIDKKPEKCTACIETEINEIATTKLERMGAALSGFDFYVAENNTSFSYLEALFIFIILHDHADIFTGYIATAKNLNLTGSDDYDTDIVTELLSKKLMYEIDDSALPQTSYFEEDMSYLRRNESSLTPNNKSRYRGLSLKIPTFGFYVALPSMFEDSSILMSFLYEEILTKKIGLKDTKQLEELINKTLLHKAYQLIPIIENEYRIRIERSLKLETVLLHGVKSFSLNQVYNVLNYFARLTAANMHSQPDIHWKIHERAYVNKVESRLNALAALAEEKRYKKYLPDSFIDSKVEVFSSRYFLGGVMSWANLSGEEVLRRWVFELEGND